MNTNKRTEKIGWKHIVMGFLAWALLMLAPAGCVVSEHEDRLRALEENRQTYLILDLDTVVSHAGDTTIYETRIYAPSGPGTRKGGRSKYWR